MTRCSPRIVSTGRVRREAALAAALSGSLLAGAAAAPRETRWHRDPGVDENLWGPARRRYRELFDALTRRFPARNHQDFVHVHATVVTPALARAEAEAWGSGLDMHPGAIRERAARHTPAGRLTFQIELVNHRWPVVEHHLKLLLGATRLEIDGRFFPVSALDRPFFDRMLSGQVLNLSFAFPPGEPALPGPSAKVVRLWFPGLANRKRSVPRIRFEPELFGVDWVHPRWPADSGEGGLPGLHSGGQDRTGLRPKAGPRPPPGGEELPAPAPAFQPGPTRSPRP